MAALPHVDGVEHEWVEAGGTRLHVATAGPADGPVVVLLHGWPQHWWLWREQLPALAQDGHRVLAFDLRGSGWSDVPDRGYDKEQFATDVLAALDTLGVERFALAGHDWGGYTAQLMALRAPERVSRLALLNIIPVWGRFARALPNAWRTAYQLPLLPPLLGPAVQRSPLVRRVYVGVDGAARRVYAAPLREPARARAGTEMYRDFWRHDLPASLRGAHDGRRLRAPTLVLHGADDFVVHRSLVEGFRDHADDLEIAYVEGAGHFVVDERPDEVTRRLRAHFRT